MAAWRRAIELSLGDLDLEKLRMIARSRTEPASRVERARILLGYWESSSFFAVAQALRLHHQPVQRCVERAVAEDPMAALDDRSRPGREPSITLEAKAWLTSLSCRKAKDLGYPHELWTTRLLARHAREHGPAEGHPCLANLAQGTLCKILDSEEVKPHKVRYYLEKRDPEFAEKMAEVLCVYRKVKLLKKAAARSKRKPNQRVAIVSYDEKTRYSGDCDDVPRSAARARRSCDLRPRPRIQAPRHGHPAGRHRPCDRQGSRHGRGPPSQPRVRRVPQASRQSLFGRHGDPPYPGQSFRAYLQGDKSLARRATRGPLQVHLHSQAWLVAQPRRGLLLQAGPLRAAPYPRLVQTRAQGSHPDSHRLLQSRSRRSHLDLQTRQGRLI